MENVTKPVLNPAAADLNGGSNQQEPGANSLIERTTKSSKCCELCSTTQTPMWRRGPGGKGTLCNACGVKWALRRRAVRKTDDSSKPVEVVTKSPQESTFEIPEQYYCKYCGVTWPLNSFKNRQQFGAHCSNCSRKRKSREIAENLPADSSATSSQPRQLSNINKNPHDTRSSQKKHETQFDQTILMQHDGDTEDEYVDIIDDFGPPVKRKKQPTEHATSTDDEGSHDSDSETAPVLSPYGPPSGGLSRLLGAVESVLNEEREIAMIGSQMRTMRRLINTLDGTRKSSIDALESTVIRQLNHIQSLVESVHVSAVAFPQQTDQPPSTDLEPSVEKREDSSKNEPEANSSLDAAATLAMVSNTNEQTAPVNIVNMPQKLVPETIQSDLPQNSKSPNPPSSLAFQLAAQEMSTIFHNSLALHLSTSTDIETLKGIFVQYLQRSKLQIAQELTSLSDLLVALKQRQEILIQGSFIDQQQILQISLDIRNLNQRVMQSSRAFQAMFVQLAAHFTEKIEAAKRVYQEQAGNQVRLLDDTLRTKLQPTFDQEIDTIRHKLNGQVDNMNGKLSLLDNIIMSTE